MSQVLMNKKIVVDKDGPKVVATFDCFDEEQADRLIRCLVLGEARGSIRFSLKIVDDDYGKPPKEPLITLVE